MLLHKYITRNHVSKNEGKQWSTLFYIIINLKNSWSMKIYSKPTLSCLQMWLWTRYTNFKNKN